MGCKLDGLFWIIPVGLKKTISFSWMDISIHKTCFLKKNQKNFFKKFKVIFLKKI